MKNILLIVLVLLGSIAYAQKTVTTIDSQICYWNDSAKEFTDSCRYKEENPARLSFNDEETMFIHTTFTMTSTYYVTGTDHKKEEDGEVYIYFTTSDVGNKYIVFIDLEYNEVRFMPADGSYIISSIIKRVFVEED
tara:strand:- start:719 stop:1126 length:408 start_codon:yes stop_codon:yes gene_type:complete